MRFVRERTNKSSVCAILKLNRSSVYYKSKRKSDELESEVIYIFKKHLSNYGSRRIKAELKKEGKIASKRRICRILSKNGLESKHGRKKLAKNIHTSNDKKYIADNRTSGKSATKPGEVVHTDFTEIQYKGGKLYVSGMIDAYDKNVVLVYGMRQTKELVKENLERLSIRPQILHSDRGPQYTSTEIRDYLEKHGILRSMSAPYCSYQNAYIESFWKTLKVEIGSFANLSLDQVILVLSYYEHYYNNERIHSSLNYMTPSQFRALSFSNVSEKY